MKDTYLFGSARPMTNKYWELPVYYRRYVMNVAPRLPGRTEVARRTKFAVICCYRQNFWIVGMAGLGPEYYASAAVKRSTDPTSPCLLVP